MIRVALIAAAVAVAGVAVPAGAATIVQTDRTNPPSGFTSFNSALGTLSAVTLEVAASITRYYDLFGSTENAAVVPFSYAINSSYRVTTPAGQVFVPVSGSGAFPVALSPRPGFSSYGTAEGQASGSATFDLDPTAFIGAFRFIASGRDPNYQFFGDGVAADTQVSAPGTSQINQVRRVESDSASGASLRLTYTFTPFAAAVPEPATWGMLIVGFALVGGAMRRRIALHAVSV